MCMWGLGGTPLRLEVEPPHPGLCFSEAEPTEGAALGLQRAVWSLSHILEGLHIST